MGETTRALYDGFNHGDYLSLWELFARHRESLIRYVRRAKGRSPALAGMTEDVVGEALLKVVRHLELGLSAGRTHALEVGKFEPYMRQVAKRVLLDLWAALAAHAHVMDGNLHDPDASGDPLQSVAAPEPSPPDELVRDEELGMLSSAFEALPARDREILVLWILEVPYSDIAARLGMTIDAVMRAKSRAQSRLTATRRRPLE